MKKVIGILLVAVAILGFADIKKYNAQFTEQEINELMFVVDKSTADHQVVKKVQDHLVTEFKPQFAIDTTKPKK